MTAANSTRVLLCDDHEVVREGLRTLLSRHQDIAVVGEAGTMAEAIEAAAKAKPDVVIMDVRLPDGSGVEACRAIREARPETRVIMLTSYADDEALFASIIAGASGYLLKQTRGQAVVDAIQAVDRPDEALHLAHVGDVHVAGYRRMLGRRCPEGVGMEAEDIEVRPDPPVGDASPPRPGRSARTRVPGQSRDRQPSPAGRWQRHPRGDRQHLHHRDRARDRRPGVLPVLPGPHAHPPA